MGLSECCRNIRNRVDILHDRGSLAPAVIFLIFQTLAGIGLLAISVWLYLDTTSYLAGYHYYGKFFISIYILMGAGSLMTLIGFLGCCGAMQENACMLGTFGTFVLIVFAAEVAGVVYGYNHKEEIEGEISFRVRDMVRNGYGVQGPVTIAVDAMQKKLSCCGIKGPGDWSESTFNLRTREASLLDKLMYKVPNSCCSLNDEEECKKLTSESRQSFFTHGIHESGCLEKVKDKIMSHLTVIIAVGIGIAVIQIFGLVFSFILCCAISSDRY